jgi:thymidylate synthase (FAD)
MSEVKLVALSKPSVTTECHTAEDFIAYAARVSNPANQNNTETAQRLIKYLIREKHWSPFEMVSVTMEIRTTRDISRQILRHRSFSFQEFSQRYAVSEAFTLRQARLQDPKNRQNSIPIEKQEPSKDSISTPESRLLEKWNMMQKQVIETARVAYDWALDNGIAKEQARAVLPEGNTETTLYMAGTLRSWIHYCDLRMANGTQKEHMVVAQQCWDVLQYHFPNVCSAVTELNGEK